MEKIQKGLRCLLPVAALVCLFGMARAQAAPEQCILSFTGDPKTTQTATWKDTTATHGVMEVVSEAQYQERAFIGATQTAAQKTEDLFSATMIGLVPNTSYYYRVGDGTNWTDTGTFQTAASSGEFTFLYLGDVQEGMEQWGTMVEEVYDMYAPAFGLVGGDLVNNANSKTEWNAFFQAASPAFSKMSLMPVVGNHDIGVYELTSQKPELYLKRFTLPENGPQGYLEEFYSFDYQNVHFLVLNSMVLGKYSVPGSQTYQVLQEWIKKDLYESEAKWNVVLLHHPPYTMVADNVSSRINAEWLPLLEQGGTDLVLCGHQHAFMRTEPLTGGRMDANMGIVTIMGNSGSKTYEPQNQPYIAAYDTQYDPDGVNSNYQLIEVSDDVLRVTTYRGNHELMDVWEKTTPNSEKLASFSFGLEGDTEIPGAGDDVQVTLSLDRLDKNGKEGYTLYGAQTEVTYDPEKMTYKSAQSGAGFQVTEETKGTLKVAYYNPDQSGNVASHLCVATLTFQVKTGNGGTLTQQNCIVTDEKGAPYSEVGHSDLTLVGADATVSVETCTAGNTVYRPGYTAVYFQNISYPAGAKGLTLTVKGEEYPVYLERDGAFAACLLPMTYESLGLNPEAMLKAGLRYQAEDSPTYTTSDVTGPSGTPDGVLTNRDPIFLSNMIVFCNVQQTDAVLLGADGNRDFDLDVRDLQLLYMAMLP
ncbi:MAG: metallophosphoesterase [Oscillospiraceae bacterium]|jgi:3',5'-cyclic AMP phosphodiesterase CpdA